MKVSGLEVAESNSTCMNCLLELLAGSVLPGVSQSGPVVQLLVSSLGIASPNCGVRCQPQSPVWEWGRARKQFQTVVSPAASRRLNSLKKCVAFHCSSRANISVWARHWVWAIKTLERDWAGNFLAFKKTLCDIWSSTSYISLWTVL